MISKKLQKEKDAKILAYLIDSVATRCMAGEISIENHNLINEALWSEAKRMRIWRRVDSIVNNRSEEEMNEAMKEMGID